MGEVEILPAKKNLSSNRRRGANRGISINRLRVAAYCRVSTDDEEQLGSFKSQKLYYDDKIRSNKEWVFAGIFADEAITGTKIDKRKGFQEMIRKCMDGEIDLILTKSISRFSRNTQDTLKYVRMLREKNIAIIFEKENINTMDMNGELLLTILSSLAQGEVESLSNNVKLGIQMKMKRGELFGFHGCYGYDYHKDSKSIIMNEAEAKVVRMIFDWYTQGYGTSTIARYLISMGIKNKKGEVQWRANGIVRMITNEKYVGDLLLGKTFTVDPISKRRLKNMGESNQYYIRDHHEAIVSRETWDKAQEIHASRIKSREIAETGNRERYTRQYAFSSMLECVYCGHKLSRRTRHQTTSTVKPVWQCMNATKNGIDSCPYCKAIDEAILESAFVDSMQMIVNNYDDVFDSVLNAVKDTLRDDSDIKRIRHLNKKIDAINNKKNKLTNLLIDDKIEQTEYEQKKAEFQFQLHQLTGEKQLLEDNVGKRQNVSKRMSELCDALKLEGNPLSEFDRLVFESITEKVIVGGYDDENNPLPYKLCFILKCNQNLRVKDAKADYKLKNQKKKKVTK